MGNVCCVPSSNADERVLTMPTFCAANEPAHFLFMLFGVFEDFKSIGEMEMNGRIF
jgi:hypothetical protein